MLIDNVGHNLFTCRSYASRYNIGVILRRTPDVKVGLTCISLRIQPSAAMGSPSGKRSLRCNVGLLKIILQSWSRMQSYYTWTKL